MTTMVDALRAQVQCLERQLRQWQASCDELRKERDELRDALQELYDFAVPTAHYRTRERATEAFNAAGKILRKGGGG